MLVSARIASMMRSKRVTGGRGAARFLFLPGAFWHRALPWLLGILLLISLCRIEQKIAPAAEKACAYECRRLASDLVAESVAETLRIVSESELSVTTPVYDEDGTVTAIHTSSGALNAVQTMLLEQVNASLADRQSEAFSIRCGTLTGLYSLAGRGPEIPLHFHPTGAAQVMLHSSFAEGGINQTVHRITAEIVLTVGCSIPLYHAEETIHYTYLLAETVIVGDIPAVTWSGTVLPAA